MTGDTQLPQPGMEAVDLILTNGIVITVDEDRRILERGAVAVAGSRIVGVDSPSAIASRFRASRTIDVRGGVIQPGFVDCHVHLSHHLGRGTVPDWWPESQEHDQWLPYWLNMTLEDARLSAQLACLEMLHNGTTTFCDMSGRHEAEVRVDAATAVGLRGAVSEVCWDIPPYESVSIGGIDDCLRRLQDLVERFPMTPDAPVWGGIALSGMGKASDQLLVEAKSLAASKGLTMHMHQSFAQEDVAAFRSRTGTSAVDHLRELGILGPDLTLVHMIHTEPVEVDLLATSQTNVVHCPGASIRSGMGVSRVGHFPEMVERGITVGLGSDSGNYSDFFDVGRQAYLAATIHREARRSNPVISAEQAFEMATIKGAKAMGLDATVGSIEIGKQADLVVHSRRRPEWHPCLDVINTLVYSAQSTGVDFVVVGGHIVLEGGESTRVDEVEILNAVDRAARSLYSRMGWTSFSRWPVT